MSSTDETVVKTGSHLPNDLIDVITEHCPRYTLAAFCLVDTSFYAVAIKHLYKAPFSLDANDSDEDRRGGKYLRGQIRSFMLCCALTRSPNLAGRVRIFNTFPWGNHLLSKKEMQIVLPHLHNLITVELYHHVDLFDLCPSKQLMAVHIHHEGEKSLGWLVRQTNVRRLELPADCAINDTYSLAFPKLEKLKAGVEVAKRLLPFSSPLVRFLDVTTGSDDAHELPELVRNYCPDVQDLFVTVLNKGVLDRTDPEGRFSICIS
ncbi:hypothetical protein FRB97_008180 [Tulasnella sp. 331]|nr:hypothetical protein FRB97_008180 [Tulasnella sp. 331]